MVAHASASLLLEQHLGVPFDVEVGVAADVDRDLVMVPPVNAYGGSPG